MKIEIPNLQFEDKASVFKKHTNIEISDTIKGWIIYGDTHRQLDKKIFNLNPTERKGWESWSILAHLGLKKEFKGLFKDMTVDNVINVLKKDKQDFSQIISYLKLENPFRVITADDSFVWSNNKTGVGNGEGKAFLGPQKSITYNYWGELNEFIKVSILKENLLDYYFQSKNEFYNPTQAYRNKIKMKQEFNKAYEDISILKENIELNFEIYTGKSDKTRVYLRPEGEFTSNVTEILRKISLKNYTQFVTEKIGDKKFEFKLKFIPSGIIQNPTTNSNNLLQIPISELPKILERNIYSYVTNEKLVKEIKKMYSHCQFCFYKFEDYINSNGDRKQYSEAAHIKPKSEGGLDNLNNILCLCANCHSLFDLGTLYIDDNYVVRKSEKLLNESKYEDSYFNELELNEDHELELSNIRFHRKLTKNN